MAFHDEYENALGADKRRMPRMAKIALVLGAVLLIGAGALAAIAGLVVRKVANEFEDLMENPATVVAERLIDATPDLELLSSDMEEGTVTFRNRSSRNVQTVEAEKFLEGRLDIHTDDGDFSIDVSADDNSGVLVIRGDDGEVFRIDVGGDEHGGSLVMTTGDGEVFRLDATGDEDGGELVARLHDGEVLRLEAEGDDESGVLTLDMDGDELARLEINGNDDAVLRLRGKDGRSTTLRGISEGGRVPGWVPEFKRDVDNRKVYQANADEGQAGAVSFETSRSLDDVMAFYTDGDEFDGETHSTQWNIMGSRMRATMVSEDRDGRTITVMGIGKEDGPTHVVVTWADPN